MQLSTLEALRLLREEADNRAGTFIGGNKIEGLSGDYFRVGTKFIISKVEEWLGADYEIKYRIELLEYND